MCDNVKSKELEDIQSDIKKVADEVVKVDFAGITKQLFDKIVELKTVDEKFREMEEKINDKFNDKFNEMKQNLVKAINEKEMCTAVASKCDCNKEFMMSQLNAQENEVNLLNEE